jgi:hypothetical protein
MLHPCICMLFLANVLVYDIAENSYSKAKADQCLASMSNFQDAGMRREKQLLPFTRKGNSIVYQNT